MLSDYFDVQRQSIIVPFNSNPTGIGGGGGQGQNTACAPTVAEPVCGDLVLTRPNGVLSDQIGSVGFCSSAECLTDEYIQALVQLNPSIYNKNAPMKIVMKCHPSLCDDIARVTYGGIDRVAPKAARTTSGSHITCGSGCGGGGGGGYFDIKKIKLVSSKAPTGALSLSPSCATSGKVGSTQGYCTDYYASFRGSNGIWNIVWLSPGDARVSFPK